MKVAIIGNNYSKEIAKVLFNSNLNLEIIKKEGENNMFGEIPIYPPYQMTEMFEEMSRNEWLRGAKFKCHNRNRKRKKNRLNVSRLARKKNRK